VIKGEPLAIIVAFSMSPNQQHQSTEKVSELCHSSPSIWNSLPLSVTEVPSIGTFKCRLKSFYFNSLVS